jgi:hypothetical protein
MGFNVLLKLRSTSGGYKSEDHRVVGDEDDGRRC